MPPGDDNPKSPLKPWVLPLMIGSVAVIVIGILSTYADTTGGAFIVALGIFGFCWAAWGAAQSPGDR